MISIPSYHTKRCIKGGKNTKNISGDIFNLTLSASYLSIYGNLIRGSRIQNVLKSQNTRGKKINKILFVFMNKPLDKLYTSKS